MKNIIGTKLRKKKEDFDGKNKTIFTMNNLDALLRFQVQILTDPSSKALIWIVLRVSVWLESSARKDRKEEEAGAKARV